jgi:hypothetical protein
MEKKEPLVSQSEHHCSNITEQTGHFIAPDSIVGFNAPWVSKYQYIQGVDNIMKSLRN